MISISGNVIREIMMKEGPCMDYPAFYVSPASGNLEWFPDMDAAQWLL